jgi:hypothetical protein
MDYNSSEWFGFNSPNQTILDMPPVSQPVTSPVAISAKIELTKFHGYTSENAQKFLDEFESFCTLQNLKDNSRVIAAFHLHLKGPALVWFTALEASDKLSWTVVKEAFNAQYLSRSLYDPAIIAESAIFDALTLQPGAPIEGFHSQVLEKGSRLEKPERDLTAKFINGLPQQLAFFVRAANPKNLQAAFQQAKLGEAYGYRQSTAPVSVAAVTPKEPSATSTNMEKLLSQLVERMDRLEARDPERKAAHRPRPAPAHPTRNSRYVCYNCSGPNHRQAECNWNGKGPREPSVLCQICKQNGHSALACKKVAVAGN